MKWGAQEEHPQGLCRGALGGQGRAGKEETAKFGGRKGHNGQSNHAAGG